VKDKGVPEGSFREDILKLLRENPEKEFSFQEIVKLFGRSAGSTSGTLSILYKEGLIKKSNTYPAKYLYNPEPVTSQANKASSPNKDGLVYGRNLDLIGYVQLLREEMKDIDNRITELQKRREDIRITIETTERTLANL
jgi:DNA-binding transcriptional ArsR family regulator